MGSTRQNKNRKQTVLEHFKAVPHNTFIVAVLGIALIGSTLLILTRAQGTEELYVGGTTIRFINNGNINHSQNRDSPRESTISVDIGSKGDLPESQILVVYTYNTNFIQGSVNVTCRWQHGCFKSGWDGPQRQFTHGERIVTCHTVPANYHVTGAPLINFRSQLVRDRTLTEKDAIDNIYYGSAPGSCQSNPSANGVEFTSSIDGCGDPLTPGGYECGPSGGSAPIYIGFTSGNGGNGNGNGGNGTGTNGNGQGTGSGSGGGGGGSSANTQAEQPNTVPSSSSQGQSNQPELEPSPFFDGKQYEPGSDPDLLGVNTTFSIAGHSLKYGWAYVVGVVLLAGSATGYFLWWNKLKPNDKAKFRAKLSFRRQ